MLEWKVCRDGGNMREENDQITGLNRLLKGPECLASEALINQAEER